MNCFSNPLLFYDGWNYLTGCQHIWTTKWFLYLILWSILCFEINCLLNKISFLVFLMTYICGFWEREVGMGRNSEIAKQKMLGLFFLLSVTHAAIDLLQLPSSPAWVYLGLSACVSSQAGLYKAPGYHCGRHSMSHPLFFMCFSHSHLRATSRWDSWGSGMLSGGPRALPAAGEPMEIASWSCTVPQALHPFCACSSPQLLVRCSHVCVHTGWRHAVLGTDF